MEREQEIRGAGGGAARRAVHPVRGFIVAFILAVPMFISAATAFFALLNTVVAGFLPGSWFSSNPVDWLLGVGTEGSGSGYIIFMISAMVAYACYRAIWWGYNGPEK